jgi:hypothetical protein
MRSPLGIVLLVVGVILLVFGINASESFASDVKEFFEGTPTDRSIWFLIGGAVAIVVGLVLMLAGGRRAPPV